MPRKRSLGSPLGGCFGGGDVVSPTAGVVFSAIWPSNQIKGGCRQHSVMIYAKYTILYCKLKYRTDTVQHPMGMPYGISNCRFNHLTLLVCSFQIFKWRGLSRAPDFGRLRLNARTLTDRYHRHLMEGPRKFQRLSHNYRQ